MVKNLERELTLLKKELAMHDTLANRSQVTYDPLSEQQRYEIRQQVRAFLEGKTDDIEVSLFVFIVITNIANICSFCVRLLRMLM